MRLVHGAGKGEWIAFFSFAEDSTSYAFYLLVGRDFSRADVHDLRIIRVGERIKSVEDEFEEIVDIGFSLFAHPEFCFYAYGPGEGFGVGVAAAEFGENAFFGVECFFRGDGVSLVDSWSCFCDRVAGQAKSEFLRLVDCHARSSCGR